ncbi:MAG: hypothetical protein PHW96_02715, partial [Candidatus Nanoarchaeia archaeon]|nr:hypothetical protein [Candidatus Nanoarchaeia archaeon]
MEDYRPRPSKFRISGNKKKKYLFLLKAMMDEINAVIDYVQKFKDSKTELEKLETNSKGVKCGYCNNSAETFSIYRFNLIRDVNYKDGRYTPVVRHKNFCEE